MRIDGPVPFALCVVEQMGTDVIPRLAGFCQRFPVAPVLPDVVVSYDGLGIFPPLAGRRIEYGWVGLSGNR